MDLPENHSMQGNAASSSSGSASAKPSLVEPFKSKQASTSQQHTNMPRPTAAPAREQVSEANDHDARYSKLSSRDGWDGVMIDKLTFPLSEIMDLIALQSSDHFYGYARANGRVGIIMDNLMDARLRAMAKKAAAHRGAEVEQVEAKAARTKSKGKGKVKEQARTRATAPEHAATGTRGQTTESEIPSQTFEQICGDLIARIESIDTSRCTEADKQRNKVCMDAIKAVSVRSKDPNKQSVINHVVAASTPPATDLKTRCSVRPPFPSHGEPCGRRLPCLVHSTSLYFETKPLFDMPVVGSHSESDPHTASLLFPTAGC